MRKATRRSRQAKESTRHGRLPAQPTHHYPGSVAKLDVMAERLLRNECLFHPGDVKARRDEDTVPTKIERLVYSGSSRRSEIKEKSAGKPHEWDHKKKVTTYVLTDKQWQQMKICIPIRTGLDRRQTSVVLAQHRNAINGMFYVLFRGIKWTEVPERYCYFGLKRKRGKNLCRVWNAWKTSGKWLHMLRAAKLVDAEDRIQWHKLLRVTVLG